MEQKSRNFTVDILRVIGIFLVILAHVPTPSALYEFRTFDVVMLVFISGVSFSLSFNRLKEPYIDYVMKRLKRLVLPIWIFLFFFIPFAMLIGVEYSVYEIITSVFLLSGVGYIWIFRVFFINSLLAPIAKMWTDTSKFSQIAVSVLLMLVTNEILLIVSEFIGSDVVKSLFELLLVFTIGYLIPFTIGLIWVELAKDKKIVTFGVFSMIFLFFLIYLKPTTIQDFKYPPRALYISYGMVASLLLYYIASKVNIKSIKVIGIITWISKYSLDIYLWHIVVITILSRFEVFVWSINELLLYCIVLGVSMLCTILQVTVTRSINLSKLWSKDKR